MNLEQTKEFKKVYSRLQDDISRRIYKQRLLYSLLGDKQELYQLACDNSKIEELLNAKKFCFYGAGVGGENLLGNIINLYNPFYDRDLKPEFMIDNNKIGNIKDVPIISYKQFLELPDYQDYLIIVTVDKPNARMEIEKSLNKHNLNYIHGYEDLILLRKQYFDLPELNLKNEYFVDAGGFDGKSTELLFECSGVGYSYIFEPNENQQNVIKTNLKKYKNNIQVLPYGLSDENKVASFICCPSGSFEQNSTMAENGLKVQCDGTYVSQIEIRKMDDVLQAKKVTYIKMDIEGSELAALKGAENIIRTQKPKLAICVYHKPEDMWEIPSLLLEYCPDYKFYLRHYNCTAPETVLYAI